MADISRRRALTVLALAPAAAVLEAQQPATQPPVRQPHTTPNQPANPPAQPRLETRSPERRIAGIDSLRPKRRSLW